MFSAGHLAECGSHEELMRIEEGEYRKVSLCVSLPALCLAPNLIDSPVEAMGGTSRRISDDVNLVAAKVEACLSASRLSLCQRFARR
jgi:hypothetical protein